MMLLCLLQALRRVNSWFHVLVEEMGTRPWQVFVPMCRVRHAIICRLEGGSQWENLVR